MLFESKKQELNQKINKAKKYKKESVLSWDSSFGEQRKRNKISFLNYPSSFNEIKHVNNIKESIDSSTYENDKGTVTAPNRRAVHNPIHDHPDIKPHDLESNFDHTVAISRYSSTESGPGHSAVINNYLRKKAGDPNAVIRPKYAGTEEEHIKKLSAAFTPGNVTKTDITTYSGIPGRIGKQLQAAGNESEHVLPGFTSTSTHKPTAIEFAKYATTPTTRKELHLLKLHVKAGAGMSIVPVSYNSENEILLHHGAHITYHGTTTEQGPDGEIYHIHHVTVHNKFLPLSEY